MVAILAIIGDFNERVVPLDKNWVENQHQPLINVDVEGFYVD